MSESGRGEGADAQDLVHLPLDEVVGAVSRDREGVGSRDHLGLRLGVGADQVDAVGGAVGALAGTGEVDTALGVHLLHPGKVLIEGGRPLLPGDQGTSQADKPHRVLSFVGGGHQICSARGLPILSKAAGKKEP